MGVMQRDASFYKLSDCAAPDATCRPIPLVPRAIDDAAMPSPLDLPQDSPAAGHSRVVGDDLALPAASAPSMGLRKAASPSVAAGLARYMGWRLALYRHHSASPPGSDKTGWSPLRSTNELN